MKKKGLIVATIVMVLVLAVSLTTATYAWFTAMAQATVEDIVLTAGQSPNLLIGVKNKAVDTTTSAYADYMSGDMTFSAGKWTGTAGLGGEDTINFNLGAWNLGKAVSYTTTPIEHDSEVKAAADSWYTALGSGNDIDESSVTAAINGTDYIDATFIVAIGKADTVKQTYLEIVVTPTGGTANIGMAAALHFFIAVGDAGEAENAFDAMTYASSTIGTSYTTPSTTLSSHQGKVFSNGWSDDVTVGSYNDSTGAWTLLVPIHEFSSEFYATQFATSKQVRLIIWLEGSDDSCVASNAGTGATIEINFTESATQVVIDENGVLDTTP